MKYMGSKSKIANDILPIILKNIDKKKCYVEPFCGGLNMMDKITIFKPKIASDYNPFLIAMWIGLQNDFDKPLEIPKSLYDEYRTKYNTLKNNKEFIKDMFSYSPINIKLNDALQEGFLIGWVGFMASFNGRFYDGGYSGKTENRNYIDEQIRNTLKQVPLIKDITFIYNDYKDLVIPNNSIIYCDIPYKDTKQYIYSSNFNHDDFWQWCRNMINIGNELYVSEYNAPDDFDCIWSKEVTNSLNTTKTYKPIEKLFTIIKNKI